MEWLASKNRLSRVRPVMLVMAIDLPSPVRGLMIASCESQFQAYGVPLLW